MADLIDLTGKKFGRLTVLNKSKDNYRGCARWDCICDCGNKTTVLSQALRRNLTLSCGCLKVELQTKHGLSREPEYKSWNSMIDRCTKANRKAYKNYGARGIKVCDRWMKSFENFLEDMGKRPTEKHTLDRIDVNGDYEPSNCRWATYNTQARNRRPPKNGTGYPGVTWRKDINKWRVAIGINNKKIVIGTFESFNDAVEARKTAEFKYWGTGGGACCG